jgi:cobalt-zinc-cadmium efflux system protein
MSTGHNHSHVKTSQERPLLFALMLTSVFLLTEAIGGVVTQSLALISDAAHMLTDVTALAISFVAIKIGQRAADLNRTFGYYRFEILAAVFNTMLLFLVALYIIYEAYQRLNHPAEIHSIGMLIIACLGLVVNLISMRLLTAGKEHNMNMKSAYLEVWSDMLGSIGVIFAAVTIYFTEWKSVDSVIAILIGLWVLPRTFVLLKESINILLEGVPKEIDFNKLKDSMCKIEGVLDVHELHVWAISSDKISLTSHLVIDPTYDNEMVLNMIRQLLLSEFKISHTTLQHERTKCLDDEVGCHFGHH